MVVPPGKATQDITEGYLPHVALPDFPENLPELSHCINLKVGADFQVDAEDGK